MTSQKCTTCNEIKQLTEFSTRKSKKGEVSYRSECKKCRCQREKERRANNKEKFKEKDKQYYEKNKETMNERSREYNKSHKEDICAKKKQYYEKNKDTIKQYHIKNKTKRNIRVREKRKICIQTRISHTLRARLSDIVKKVKGECFITLIGCTKRSLLKWIEIQLTKELSWQNYGTYWHIDHVIPISWFDLREKNEKAVCFHWSNLRPLKKKDNMKKSNKILKADILDHIEKIESYVKGEEDQTTIERKWWRRLKLRYGNTSQDEEFEEILKWAIRMQDATEEA